LAGFKPATFGFSGKYTNHYTTKVTNIKVLKIPISYLTAKKVYQSLCYQAFTTFQLPLKSKEEVK
jgi:hypothetical protein